MVEAETMIEGLSGVEIIDDILAQIRIKLEKSCDLRSIDCYGQGYSAEIDIRLKLYDTDTISVNAKVEIPPKVEQPVSTDDVIVTPIEIEEKFEIPQELNVEAVRNRTKESAPPPPVEYEENLMPERTKRKYTRRSFAPVPASGEVVDIDA